MNRIDRLFGIVLRLQGRRRVRAEDLAEAFGVSTRTVYRDIAALAEVGVPVVSLPGQGYELMPGFFLPPLVFTGDEASALVLGARLLGHQASGRIAEGATSATAKIAAALPEPTRRETERLAETIAFLAEPSRFDLDDARLSLLRRAIGERRPLRLRHHGLGRDAAADREVEPLQLVYADGRWYLRAWCRLRREERDFRLDRIEGIHPLPGAFAPRTPSTGAGAATPPAYEARVRVNGHAARWVRERQHYGFVGEAPAGDDVVMTYRVNRPDELTHWLRGWGPEAEALAPADLRGRLRRDADAVAAMLARGSDEDGVDAIGANGDPT